MPILSGLIQPTSETNPVILVDDNKMAGIGIFDILDSAYELPGLMRRVGYTAICYGNQQTSVSVYVYNGPGQPDTEDLNSTILDDDWSDINNWVKINEIVEGAVSSFTNDTDGYVVTANGSSSITGEANLNFSGSTLVIKDTSTATTKKIQLDAESNEIKYLSGSSEELLGIPKLYSSELTSDTFTISAPDSDGGSYTFPKRYDTDSGKFLGLNSSGVLDFLSITPDTGISITSNFENGIVIGQGADSGSVTSTNYISVEGYNTLVLSKNGSPNELRISSDEIKLTSPDGEGGTTTHPIPIYSPKINNQFTFPSSPPAAGTFLQYAGDGETQWAVIVPEDTTNAGISSFNGVTSGGVSVNGVGPISFGPQDGQTNIFEISFDGDGYLNVTPDWNADSGEAGYIDNKPDIITDVIGSDAISASVANGVANLSLGDIELGQLSNVNIESVSNQQALIYNDGAWAPQTIVSQSDIDDAVSSITHNWTGINGIPDNVTSVANGNYVQSINGTLTGEVSLNVDAGSGLTMTQSGDSGLIFSIDTSLLTGDGATTLNGLSDVQNVDVQDNQILITESSNGEISYFNRTAELPVTTNINDLDWGIDIQPDVLPDGYDTRLMLMHEFNEWKKVPFDYFWYFISNSLNDYLTNLNINVGSGAGTGADINQDGTIGTDDLLLLLSGFGSVTNDDVQIFLNFNEPVPNFIRLLYSVGDIPSTSDNELTIQNAAVCTVDSGIWPTSTSVSVLSSLNSVVFDDIIRFEGLNTEFLLFDSNSASSTYFNLVVQGNFGIILESEGIYSLLIKVTGTWVSDTGAEHEYVYYFSKSLGSLNAGYTTSVYVNVNIDSLTAGVYDNGVSFIESISSPAPILANESDVVFPRISVGGETCEPVKYEFQYYFSTEDDSITGQVFEIIDFNISTGLKKIV